MVRSTLARLIGRAAEKDEDGRMALSQMRVAGADIDGAKADVRLVSGDHRPPAPIPMEKTADGWKEAGTTTDVTYRSQAEAECVAGGMSSFDEGEVDRFWKREGRDDFRDYIVRTCRRADARGLLDEEAFSPAEFERIAGRVLLGMVRSGQVRDPR